MASSGGRAFLGRLSDLAPKRSARSAPARFREMSRSTRGRSYLDRSGVSGSARTQQGWLSGERAPSKSNRDAIDRAYQDWQRDNLAARASKGGRTVEVYPDADVVRKSRGGVSPDPVKVTLTEDEWRRMSSAAQSGDDAEANRVWQGAIAREIIGSPPARAYATVDHVWFGG